jgi:hypothetical protein
MRNRLSQVENYYFLLVHLCLHSSTLKMNAHAIWQQSAETIDQIFFCIFQEFANYIFINSQQINIKACNKGKLTRSLSDSQSFHPFPFW